jgi:rhodanese-related sulfurtransferase
MGDILQALPSARRALFAQYHIGGCSSCAYHNDETLGQVCTRNGLDFNEVVACIQRAEDEDKAMLVEPRMAAEWGQQSVPFFDVRTREEHQAVKIAGSQLLTQELQQQLFIDLSKDEKIILYDHLGRDVLHRVAWFRGHVNVACFGLRGGIDSWSQVVDPLLPRYEIEI